MNALLIRTRSICVALLVMSCLSWAALAQSTITTIAGSVNPFDGAQATTVSYGSSQAVISDGAGGFYFATQYPQNSIYRVAADGTSRLIAGTGSYGFNGDGLAVNAQLNFPSGLALDGSGNLLIADASNNRIRKVTPSGVISTIAGTGTAGFSGDGGPATVARLSNPQGVAVDGNGNILITDSGNNRIRKITPAGIITTIAGDGTNAFSGDSGPAVSARLYSPGPIVVDSTGAILFGDRFNYRVRKISINGIITTVAGNGSPGFAGDGGLAIAARISAPWGLALDAAENLYIADSGDNRIRKVTPAGVISTVAGNGNYGYSGDGGPALSAQFASVNGVAVDTGGNLLIADLNNQRIRKVSTGGVVTTVAGNGTHGFSGDGGPAATALFERPAGLAVDAAGNLLVADTGNARIRKITPAGIVSTIAGNGTFGSGGDGGPATAAQLNVPGSLAVGPDGSVYSTDCSNKIRKISPNGVISTFATGSWFFCDFYYYYYEEFSRGALVVDASGNVFVADTFGARVFKVTPDGTVSRVAGTGSYGFSGDGGSALNAQLTEPWSIAVDSAGNLYIADAWNHRIRKVTPAGIISTIAGASAGFSGDGGLATSALLNFPSSLVVDSKNNLFISDTSNYRIRRIDLTTGLITTVAGNGTQGLRGDGGSATEAQLDTPMNIALDAVGGLYIGDSNNHRIRKVTFGLTVPTLAKITEAIGAQGGAGNFMLEGTSFSIPLTINAGAGITVSDVVVLSETRATAKFTIATNAAAGPRDLNVTTDLGTSGNVTFTVVPPFADLSITSTKTGNWEVGFNGAYNIRVANDGVAPTAGPIVVTDTLPDGFSFVSGTGAGWSCSSANQDVTCSNSGPIDSGGSSTLVLIVAVGSNTGPQATHLLTASVNGDLVASNNTASDTRNVQTPFIFFNFSPTSLLPAGQATVGLSISPQFSQEVTGTLTLTFASSAAIPADDPAVQFVTGGRTVNFTIPANSSSARFSGLPQAGAIGFQTGTVAGNLTFTVSLQTGSVQTEFTNSRPVPRRPPTVHSVRKDNATTTSFNLGITVSSSEREITHLVLNFSTSPAITVSCGGVSGCTASGNALSLDVKSLFETWFKSTSQYGSLGTLTVPLTFTGTYSGTLIISLRNSLGTSNSLTVLLP